MAERQEDFEFIDPGGERLDSGVRARREAGGDGWANAHRSCLPRHCFMQDIDAFFGHIVFAKNSADRLFVEQVPDDYDNLTGSFSRNFAVVALFDRKRTLDDDQMARNRFTLQFYCWICRIFRDRQPEGTGPKFFYVIGPSHGPWGMQEIDIDTGEKTEEIRLIRNDDSPGWMNVWQALGLLSAREKAETWLRGRRP